MPLYRAYTIGPDGRVLSAAVLSECSDDASAINATRMLLRGRQIELWDKARLVAVIDHRNNQ